MKLKGINEWAISESKYTQKETDILDAILSQSGIKKGDIVKHKQFGEVKIVDILLDDDVYKSVDFVTRGMNNKYDVIRTRKMDNVENQGLYGFLQSVVSDFDSKWNKMYFKE